MATTTTYPLRIRVPITTARALQALAKRADRPVAWVVRQACAEYVERQAALARASEQEQAHASS